MGFRFIANKEAASKNVVFARRPIAGLRTRKELDAIIDKDIRILFQDATMHVEDDDPSFTKTILQIAKETFPKLSHVRVAIKICPHKSAV